MTGLEAVREHYLAEARTQAAEVMAHARDMARDILDKARADAAELTRHAEEEGQASAEQDTGRDWTAARRRARAIHLAAQRSVYDDLRTQCARALALDPRTTVLLHRIGDAARMRLGPGATITLGVSSVDASRKAHHVRWTVEEAVDDSLHRLGPEVEELWR